MGTPNLVSPWSQIIGDSAYDPATVNPAAPDHAVMISVTFDNATKTISGAVVWRAANCDWTRIVCGRGADGSVAGSTFVFDLSNLNDKTRNITAAQLAAAPYNVTLITQITALQITAY